MKKTIPTTIIALTLLGFTGLASAQPPQPGYPGHPMMHGDNMPHPMMRGQNMPHPMPHPDLAPPRMPPMIAPGFPSPEELARMAPPEPMTEEKIKDRFAKQKVELQASLERDRKAAAKYASDFARLQKFQADRLAEIMAKAEERRESMLQRLEEQEKRALEQFREQQKPLEKPAADKEAT